MPPKKKKGPLQQDGARGAVDPLATARQKVASLLTDLKERQPPQCRSVGEVNRFTKCTCLSDLLRERGPLLEIALASFFLLLDDKKATTSKLSVATSCYVFGNSDSESATSGGKTCSFLLPAGNTGVEICRSSMVELTKLYTGVKVKEANSIFPSATTMERSVKKVRLFQVLFYLQENHHDCSTSRVTWERESFAQLGVAKHNAKKLCADYNLKDVAQKVLRVDQHSELLYVWLQAKVASLDDSWLKSAIPTLVERSKVGQFDSEIRDSLWNHGQTGGRGQPIRAKAKTVKYRLIDITKNSRDKESILLIQQLGPLLAQSLHVNVGELTIEAYFVRTPEYAPQKPHYVFKPDILQRTENTNRLHLAIVPLSCLGCILQVWLGMEPHLLHVPHGTFFVVPGDTVHAGGFHMDYRTDDLHLFLYLYVAPAKQADHVMVCQSEDDFPVEEELRPTGLLYRAFTVDKLTFNQSNQYVDE